MTVSLQNRPGVCQVSANLLRSLKTVLNSTGQTPRGFLAAALSMTVSLPPLNAVNKRMHLLLRETYKKQSVHFTMVNTRGDF